MAKTKGTGTFIYGDGLNDSVPVTWRLTAGKMLSNEDSWQAEVTTIRSSSETTATDVLEALLREFIFKLKTDDGSVYLCGIYDLGHLSDSYSTSHFEICSRDQNMAQLVWND